MHLYGQGRQLDLDGNSAGLFPRRKNSEETAASSVYSFNQLKRFPTLTHKCPQPDCSWSLGRTRSLPAATATLIITILFIYDAPAQVLETTSKHSTVIGGSCRKYYFVATKTNTCISQQKYVCRDKMMFVATNILLSRQK